MWVCSLQSKRLWAHIFTQTRGESGEEEEEEGEVTTSPRGFAAMSAAAGGQHACSVPSDPRVTSFARPRGNWSGNVLDVSLGFCHLGFKEPIEILASPERAKWPPGREPRPASSCLFLPGLSSSALHITRNNEGAGTASLDRRCLWDYVDFSFFGGEPSSSETPSPRFKFSQDLRRWCHL